MKNQPKSAPAPRVGRPRREDAGDVNARILAAATELFLQKGMAATSCEAVVAQARVGKASLYSRYSGKDELFEAVVRQAVDGGTFQVEGVDVIQAPLRDRLAVAGKAVLKQALEPVPLELMRLFLTEARRFPDLIQQIDQMARDRVVEITTHAIKAERASDDGWLRAMMQSTVGGLCDLKPKSLSEIT